jgi:hypothetical protein
LEELIFDLFFLTSQDEYQPQPSRSLRATSVMTDRRLYSVNSQLNNYLDVVLQEQEQGRSLASMHVVLLVQRLSGVLKDGGESRLIGCNYPEALMPSPIIICQETRLYYLKREI